MPPGRLGFAVLGANAAAVAVLRRLIRGIPGSQRSDLTGHGRMFAVLFTKTHARIVNPSLAEHPSLAELDTALQEGLGSFRAAHLDGPELGFTAAQATTR